MERLKYCGTAGKPGGNREYKPQPKTMGVSSLLEGNLAMNVSCERAEKSGSSPE
jgi:hypothetical protein